MKSKKKSLSTLTASTIALFGGFAPAHAADFGPIEGSEQGSQLPSDTLTFQESTLVHSTTAPGGPLIDTDDLESREFTPIVASIAAAVGVISVGVSTHCMFK